MSDTIPRPVVIEDTECQIYFGDSETVCLDISRVVEKSKLGPEEFYCGPLWDGESHTISLAYCEAKKLGRVLTAFADALHAAQPGLIEELFGGE